MEPYKPHLDVLYAELVANKDDAKAEIANLSEENWNFVNENPTLTEDWHYEKFMENLFANGPALFNPLVVVANSLKLIMSGKTQVSESYNRIATLWHELNKIE
jgi:hypothetical protein